MDVFCHFLTWPEPYCSVCKKLLSTIQLEMKAPGKYGECCLFFVVLLFFMCLFNLHIFALLDILCLIYLLLIHLL